MSSAGFVYDDGGREAAGFKGQAGDCVCRSIAIATGLPYMTVYDALNGLAESERRGTRKRGVSNARSGVYKQTTRKYMASIGWRWVPTMHIGSGCTVHLRADELPAGRLVVSVSRHMTAVINGVVHDTHDPRDRGVTIYDANWPKHLLPKGARLNEHGKYVYAPERCVYGYFTNA